MVTLENPLAERDFVGFLMTVRVWLSWLLMFGVIAGLGGRALELDLVHPEDHAGHSCGHDHHHAPTDDHSHEGDPDGPHEHPHTHACCHAVPLVGVENPRQRLQVPVSTWLRVAWFTALPPDEPVFALDKPPLI